MGTFYDDAELAAVDAVRRAAAEHDGPPNSTGIHEVTTRMYDRHGSDGVAALVVALTRWHATALAELARRDGKTVEQLLDEWEMHKLEQHATERDD